jgi:hypothetical protein
MHSAIPDPSGENCSLSVNSGGLNTGFETNSLLGRIWPFGDPSERCHQTHLQKIDGNNKFGLKNKLL